MFKNPAVHLRILSVFFMLVGAASVASAQTPTIAEINTLSGLDYALEQIGEGFDTIPPEIEKATVTERLKEAWAFAQEGLFEGAALRSAINARVGGKFTAKQLSELHEFYSSPFGRHVTELEKPSYDIERQEAIKAEGARMLAEIRDGDQVRLALYQQIAEDLAAFETTEAVAMNMAYAMLAGMFAAAESPVAPSEELLTQLLQGERAKMHAEIEDSVLGQFAYCYQTLSLDDVEKYAQFLATETARRYYAETTQALDQVLAPAARTFGERLATALGQRKA